MTDSPVFASRADEKSLSDEESAQTENSLPDSLEVRSDAVAVAQDSLVPLRRPAVIAAAALAIGVVALIVISRWRGSTTPPVRV